MRKHKFTLKFILINESVLSNYNGTKASRARSRIDQGTHWSESELAVYEYRVIISESNTADLQRHNTERAEREVLV